MKHKVREASKHQKHEFTDLVEAYDEQEQADSVTSKKED